VSSPATLSIGITYTFPTSITANDNRNHFNHAEGKLFDAVAQHIKQVVRPCYQFYSTPHATQKDQAWLSRHGLTVVGTSDCDITSPHFYNMIGIEGMLEGFAIETKSLYNGGNYPHYNRQVLQLFLAGWLDAWRV